MSKWADFVISEASYDSNHLISKAKRHKDSENGIEKGKVVDRLTITSDIKNGLSYMTIYSGLSSWKQGHKIRMFRIGGQPYLRIDDNKVKLDNLGDLSQVSYNPELDLAPEPITEEEATPEQLARLEQLEEQIKELESQPEKPLPNPRGSLPKEVVTELSQELDLAPEPITEEEATPEQLEIINETENENKNFDTGELKHEIIQTLRKQIQKLSDIEEKVQSL